MSKNISRIAQIFLEKLHRKSCQEFFDTIGSLLEQLENKSDPNPEEIQLVANIYNFIEHLKTIENNIKKYVDDKGTPTTGNKLSSLYDDDKNIWS